MSRPPVVIVASCNRELGGHPFHIVGAKYVDAVRLAGALPLVAPPLAPEQLDALLEGVDGVLLTGSPSNVHPRHFGEDVRDASLPLDPERDAWTLPLVTKALERGVPLLGICRGAQEANVALGGSLHQAVHETDGLDDHRAPSEEPADVQYAARHRVQVEPGGRLEAILGPSSFEVNSLHGQGVGRLAPAARVEARAPDGLVEAFSIPGASGFNLFVQWHPEWQARTNPVSRRLFAVFGDAVVGYRDRVRGPLPRPAAASAGRR
jgi:putative glutamine amidotransferase